MALIRRICVSKACPGLWTEAPGRILGVMRLPQGALCLGRGFDATARGAKQGLAFKLPMDFALGTQA
jgi:hypothetical protein